MERPVRSSVSRHVVVVTTSIRSCNSHRRTGSGSVGTPIPSSGPWLTNWLRFCRSTAATLVEVSDAFLYGSETYRLTADTVTPVPLGEIELAGGVLRVDEPIGDVWSFDATAGQVVGVDVAVTADTFSGHYNLISPTGKVIRTGRDRQTIPLPVDGRYPAEHGQRRAGRCLRSLRASGAGGALGGHARGRGPRRRQRYGRVGFRRRRGAGGQREGGLGGVLASGPRDHLADRRVARSASPARSTSRLGGGVTAPGKGAPCRRAVSGEAVDGGPRSPLRTSSRFAFCKGRGPWSGTGRLPASSAVTDRGSESGSSTATRVRPRT